MVYLLYSSLQARSESPPLMQAHDLEEGLLLCLSAALQELMQQPENNMMR